MVKVNMTVNGKAAGGGDRCAHAAGPVPAREPAPDRHARRLRHQPMRRLRGPSRRPCGQIVHDARGLLRRRQGRDHRGLGQGGKLHPMQEAFREHHGLQCGFCTPGMIMAAVDIVHAAGGSLSEDVVRADLEGNICRCTGYHNIVAAVLAGAAAMARRRQAAGRRITRDDCAPTALASISSRRRSRRKPMSCHRHRSARQAQGRSAVHHRQGPIHRRHQSSGPSLCHVRPLPARPCQHQARSIPPRR